MVVLLALAGATWGTADSSSTLADVLGPDRAALNLAEALLFAFAFVVPFLSESTSLVRFSEEALWVLLIAAPFAVAFWCWSATSALPVDLVLASQVLVAAGAVAAGVGRRGKVAALYGGCVVALYVIPPFLSYFVGEMIAPGTLEISELSPFWTTRGRILGRMPVDVRLSIGANSVMAVGLAIVATRRRRDRVVL